MRRRYPIPLLNLYNQSHFDEAQHLGLNYSILSASYHANESYDVLLRDSGHLNLTDLPLFSPSLARLLGTGRVDSRTCIQTMNHLLLDYFDQTLKLSGPLLFEFAY